MECFMSISTRANRFSYQQLTLLEHETPGVARLRLNEPCISEPSPFRAVGLEQLIGGFGPPASGNIIHWRRGAGLLPGVEDCRDEPPGAFDLVGAREQGRIAEHHVQEQPLV